MVNLVDGLRVASRAGVGCCPRQRRSTAARAPRAPSRRGAGHRGGRRRPGRRAGGRHDGRPRAADRRAPRRPRAARGRDDSGEHHRVRHLRRRLRAVLSARRRDRRDPPRPRERGRAGRRRARATARVRRQRPSRRDAGLGRTGLPRAFRRPRRNARGRVLHEPCGPRDRRGVARGGRARHRDRSLPHGGEGERAPPRGRHRGPPEHTGRLDRGRSGAARGHDPRRRRLPIEPARGRPCGQRRVEPDGPARPRDGRRSHLRRRKGVLRARRYGPLVAACRGRRRRRCARCVSDLADR